MAKDVFVLFFDGNISIIPDTFNSSYPSWGH